MNGFYAGMLAVMAGGFAAFPLYLQRVQGGEQIPNLTRSEKPLPGHAIMRGAYNNTGSRDAGPDPDWDMSSGRYKGKSGDTFNPSDEEVTKARQEFLKKLAKKRILEGADAGLGGAEKSS